MNKLEKLIAEKGNLILDGAMGTMLFDAGLQSGNSPEEWNAIHPDRIQAIYQAYVDAGSDIILTNSFGGTRFRMKLHNLQDRVFELNKAAAENARQVVDAADHTVLVAGSMGPSGELLVPMGEMTYEACRDGFAEQARGLDAGGVDLLWIETMSDLDEVRAAYEGARSVSDLPICATLSFDTSAKTMMGVSAEKAITELSKLDLAAIGANCGNNLPDTEAVISKMRALNPDKVLIVKANAGMPEWVGDELFYSGSPEVMGAYADRMRAAGIQLIGSCCGSSPAHIRVMRDVIDGTIPVPEVEITEKAASVDAPAAAKSGKRRRRRRRD
ncbi:MAG TPA: betaine--homocysteine S-methyltransferase [Anaerolineae bacterium]|nr:betaine--homocysteine S-methyltransferase [Anaerolineae bacterium]